MFLVRFAPMTKHVHNCCPHHTLKSTKAREIVANIILLFTAIQIKDNLDPLSISSYYKPLIRLPQLLDIVLHSVKNISFDNRAGKRVSRRTLKLT